MDGNNYLKYYNGWMCLNEELKDPNNWLKCPPIL